MVKVYTDCLHRTVVIASRPSENIRAGNWVLSPGFPTAWWVRLRDWNRSTSTRLYVGVHLDV